MDVRSCLIVYQFLVFGFLKVADCSDVSIIGGDDVKKLHPWMVSVQKDQKHVCGGILIRHQWVLTAAECKEEPIKSVTVLVGTLSLSALKKGSQRVGVIGYFYPKTYNKNTKEDDIMLIKLSKKVKAKPKALPKKEQDVRTGTKCVVMGWGTNHSKVLRASDKLQMLDMTVVNRKRCNLFYEGHPKITEDMLCATNMTEKRGTCWGDTGGPLECKKNLVGIVLGTKWCGDLKKPTVYTFLSKKHISWINGVLRNQFNSTTF